MAEYVRMPQKGLTEESAILTKWYVKKGDSVKPGNLLFALETGKATFDVEAETEGTVLELVGGEGEEIAVKAVVCVIGAPGESYALESAPPRTGTSGAPEADLPKAEQAVQGPEPDPASPNKAEIPAAGQNPEISAGRIRISPRARRLAERSGLSVAGIAGTGPGGRIIEEDVRAALAKKGAPEPRRDEASSGTVSDLGAYTAVPVGNVRKAIAGAMMRSLQGMAQFTMTASFDATELLAYRERYNSSRAGSDRLSINDCILFAVSRVLLDFPYMNAHFDEREMRMFEAVHLGMAVDTPRGLLVPTIRNADGKSLAALSAEAKELGGKCRDGRVSPEELAGATFTVTNIGSYGVEFFTPVINPPQTGILGVGTVDYKRKKTSSGPADYPAMGLSLTVDHRAVDGAPGARFLQALKTELESFSLLLVK